MRAFSLNQTQSDVTGANGFAPVHRIISQYAVSVPDKAALVLGDRGIDYKTLSAQSDRIAAALMHGGIGKGDSVAIGMETGIDYILAMLGILKAGAAYIPLSTSHPLKRQQQIVDVTACRLVICDRARLKTLAPLNARTAGFASLLHGDCGLSPHRGGAVSGDDTACIIFTSGSGGTPKGVRTLHSNLAYYSHWASRFFGEAVSNKVPLTAAIHFAAATSQVFSCLCAGETLFLLPDHQQNPQALMGWYQRHPEYGLHCIPAVWSGCLKWLERNGANAPRALFISGEVFPDAMWQKTSEIAPDMPVFSLYGPTESVANVSYARLDPSGQVGIGCAIDGSHLLVIDGNGALAAAGDEGRLFISGPGICPSYVGENGHDTPILQDFDSPLTGPLRVYDTGDYGRVMDGNNIRFIGRKDRQIKLNGQRIELAEIENSLLGLAGVQNAAVILSGGTRPRLLAYLEADIGHRSSPDSLQALLRDHLPPVMVPQQYTYMDRLPRLPNGKIDRNSLSETDNRRPEMPPPPRTPDQRNITGIFKRITGIDPVAMNDSFFALGGNSLRCFELITEIEDVFGKQLDYKTIYQNPTPSALLAILDTLPDTAPKIAANAPGTQIPMTGGQRGLWLHMQIHGQSNAYNLTYRMTLTGKLDRMRFNRSFAQLCARHPMLRSTIRDDSFVILTDGGGADFTDLSNHPDGALQDMLEQSGTEPFSPDDHRLFRAHLIKTGATRHEFVFIAHHVIFDGLSADRFFQNLAALYNDKNTATFPDGFSRISARETAHKQSPAFKADRQFWAGYLSGLQNQPAFPVVYKKDNPPRRDGRQIRITLDGDIRQRLRQAAQNGPYSLHVIMLALFGAAMFSFGRAAEYVVATPFANRHTRQEQGVIGYVTNVLLYRLGCRPNATLADIMQALADDTVQFLDHQQFPLDETAALLRAQGARLPPSVFNLMFAFHDVSDWAGSMGDGLQFRAREFYCGQVKCDIFLECFDNGQTVDLHLTYDRFAIDGTAAETLANKVADGAARLHDILKEPLGDFAKPSPAERAAILKAGRGKDVEHTATLTLYDLYRQGSRHRASHTAIAFQGDVVTYRQLDARIETLAAYLWQLDLPDGAVVAILMDHAPDMVAGILACARLGIVYVPIDPTYPADRIGYITRHAGIGHILTTADLAGRFETGNAVFHPVDRIGATATQAVPENRSRPDGLLYVIYTSGSTGQPKGVMVPNRGVANYLLWMKDNFGTGGNSRILAKTSISFDISTWELFLPLISGGTLVLEHRQNLASPEQIAQVIRDNTVDIVQFVPSGLGLFCEAGMMGNIPSLKTIFSGGEALSSHLEAQVLQSGFKGELINLYGPTEASIFASWNKCSLQSPYQKVPLGRPVTNAAFYILDRDLDIMPINAAGDIYIGGDVLARGYLNDPAKTGKAFIPAPAGIPEQVLYATGDKGRLLSNGMFEYLGRNDRQVKIRGYRVECQEIENLITARDDISQAVVLVRDHGNNDHRLHVIAVPAQGKTVQGGDIMAALRRSLPPYMVPSLITFTQSIPTLANGKTDFAKAALLTDIAPPPPPEPANAPASDTLEATVFEIWAEVIGNRKFTLNDNFFDVGGHSILFLKVRDMINERLQTNFNIADLYKSPDIASLIREFKARSDDPAVSEIYQSIRDRVAKRKSRYQRKKHGK